MSSKRSTRKRKERPVIEVVDEDEDPEVVAYRRKRDNVDELIDNPEMRYCYDIVASLMENEQAEAFNEPVDWKALNLPSYPQLIKNPMDLGTVKELLLDNLLEDHEHFAEHVRLVFKNAMTFNMPGSLIYIYAENLLALFEQKYAKFLKLKENNFVPLSKKPRTEGSGEDTEIASLQETINGLRDAINQIKGTIELVKQQNEAARKANEEKKKLKRIRLTRPRKPLTYEEKEKLCQDISNLSEDRIPGLLSIISNYQKTSGTNNSDKEEVEIDIERMDDATLFAVQQYVQECLAAANKSAAQNPIRTASNMSPPTEVPSENSEIKQRLAESQAEAQARIMEIEKQLHDVKKTGIPIRQQ
jgi:bromodomain-containing factor 1